MIATGMVEKQVVGNIASTGICFWKKAEDYFTALPLVNKGPEEELFISDVHAAAIEAGKKFKVFMVDAFIDLGTPEDLDALEERWAAISE
jgi:dTDP-glucose pyrophosphorylase